MLRNHPPLKLIMIYVLTIVRFSLFYLLFIALCGLKKL